METTIVKNINGEVMEKLFESCPTFSIRHFKALNLKKETDYNPKSKYRYRLVIRHPEGTSAINLLNKAIEKTTV